MENLLELKNVSVNYGGVEALSRVCVGIDEGEMLALVGPNGAGKSTVLNAIFGLAPITKGEICWHEKTIRPIPFEMAKLGIAFVPQGRRVFASLTVLENLEVGGFDIKNKNELKRRINEIWEFFPTLRKKYRSPAGNLSGGEQQMLAIARGLMIDPKVLLLDEPSLGLSPKITKEVFAKIKEINLRHQTSIIIVEHNIRSVFEIANRVCVLDKGQVAAIDTPQKILASNILEKIFVGKI